MEMWMWLAIALLMGILGFLLGRFAESRSGRVKAMQAELDARKKELADYRNEVSRHFSKTAALFSTLTGTYRNLYHHLAEGCERLAEVPAKNLFSGAQPVLETITAARSSEPDPSTGTHEDEMASASMDDAASGEGLPEQDQGADDQGEETARDVPADAGPNSEDKKANFADQTDETASNGSRKSD